MNKKFLFGGLVILLLLALTSFGLSLTGHSIFGFLFGESISVEREIVSCVDDVALIRLNVDSDYNSFSLRENFFYGSEFISYGVYKDDNGFVDYDGEDAFRSIDDDYEWLIFDDSDELDNLVLEYELNLTDAEKVVLGDFNLDGVMNGLDISGFKSALADTDAWSEENERDANLIGDFNLDGVMNGLDLPGFKSALSEGVEPSYVVRGSYVYFDSDDEEVKGGEIETGRFSC